MQNEDKQMICFLEIRRRHLHLYSLTFALRKLLKILLTQQSR